MDRLEQMRRGMGFDDYTAFAKDPASFVKFLKAQGFKKTGQHRSRSKDQGFNDLQYCDAYEKGDLEVLLTKRTRCCIVFLRNTVPFEFKTVEELDALLREPPTTLRTYQRGKGWVDITNPNLETCL